MSWYMPTRIIAGDSVVLKANEYVQSILIAPSGPPSREGGHARAPAWSRPRCLIVCGRQSAAASGALDDVNTLLDDCGIEGVLFERVSPNPTPQIVREGARIAREAQAAMVIGIGGGSPLDAAKAIALFAVNDIPEADTFCPYTGRDALPIIAIPTTAGTGSEVTPYAILTNEAAQTKTSISHVSMFPRLALLDGRYTQSLSHETRINTALDAFSHALEGCLTKRRTPFSRALAHSTLAIIGRQLRQLADGLAPDDDARQELLEAASMAGMVIAQSGTTVGHALGYCLTVDRGIDHGRANALVMASLLDVLARSAGDEIAELLRAAGFPPARGTAAGAASTAGDASAGGASGGATTALRRPLDRLLGERERATEAEIADWARRAAASKNLANTICSPSREDLEDILRSSLAPAQNESRDRVQP